MKDNLFKKKKKIKPYKSRIEKKKKMQINTLMIHTEPKNGKACGIRRGKHFITDN